MSEMRDPTFVILTSLADGRRHGYAIIAEASSLSDGAVLMLPGTLYAALDRLGTQGLVILAHEEAVNGRLRRYYELTETGRRALAAEAQRRSELARRALARLGNRTRGRLA